MGALDYPADTALPEGLTLSEVSRRIDAVTVILTWPKTFSPECFGAEDIWGLEKISR